MTDNSSLRLAIQSFTRSKRIVRIVLCSAESTQESCGLLLHFSIKVPEEIPWMACSSCIVAYFSAGIDKFAFLSMVLSGSLLVLHGIRIDLIETPT